MVGKVDAVGVYFYLRIVSMKPIAKPASGADEIVKFLGEGARISGVKFFPVSIGRILVVAFDF